MAQIFSEWSNRLPLYLGVGVGLLTLLAVPAVGYFFSPWFTDVGYQPRQPIPFSHQLHAGELKIDCRYCHVAVEVSPVASLPSTQTCMNCHQLVSRDSALLEPLRESLSNDRPVEWIRVHKLPEYAHFDHSVHVGAGVECAHCHGDVAAMETMTQSKPLSMGWCLDCHQGRHPFWTAPGPAGEPLSLSVGRDNRYDGLEQLNPPTDCSACHQ